MIFYILCSELISTMMMTPYDGIGHVFKLLVNPFPKFINTKCVTPRNYCYSPSPSYRPPSLTLRNAWTSGIVHVIKEHRFGLMLIPVMMTPWEYLLPSSTIRSMWSVLLLPTAILGSGFIIIFKFKVCHVQYYSCS